MPIYIRKIIPFCFAVTLLVSASGCMDIARFCLGLPDFSHDSGDEHKFMVAMRDGIHLSTDVYLPEGENPWPVILMRTPYGKAGYPMFMQYMNRIFARYGYAVVAQDSRGRNDSEGEWYPILNEMNDGIDTLNWVKEQPWCNGKIGFFGASYLAIVEWAVAGQLPEEVKTMVIGIANSDPYTYAYEKGMFKYDTVASWLLIMRERTLTLFSKDMYEEFVRHLPAIKADDALVGQRQWFDDIIGHPIRGEFWERMPANTADRIDVPVLMFTGWFDVFLGGQIKDFQRLGSKENSRLLITPFGHLMGALESPDLEYPDEAQLLPQFNLILNWLDAHLKGAELLEWGPVKTFIIGENRWQEYEDWPPPNTSTVTYYLHGQGQPAECKGGLLSPEHPVEGKPTGFIYDPADPVPTRGGNLLAWVMMMTQYPPNAIEQYNICRRDDVLSFYTDPVTFPIHLAGPMTVELFVSSSAEDTAFTAKLLDVSGEKKAVNIQDGIASLATRLGEDRMVRTKPGTVVLLQIDLWDKNWVIEPGHRLRLDISSSNFPRFHRHPNQFGNWSGMETLQIAEQAVYHDMARSSRIELTVLEK
jgi:uncharacterized protein